MRGNCFVFAVWMFVTRGGYIAIRRSRHPGGLWHFLWSPDLKRWIHYAPIIDPLPWAALHKLWFRGRIKRGDAP